MAERPLPEPVTTDQWFLVAILDELRALRSVLAPERPQATEVVELIEPQPKHKRGRPKKKKQP